MKFIEINTEEAETIGLKAAFLLAFIKSNNIDKNNKNLADIISKKISFMKISEIEESIAKLERLNLIKPGTSNNLYKLKLPSGNSHGASMITKNWTPSENVYEVLSMGNIKKEFIDSKLPEFRLYWMEKNVAKDDWNHKFVNFIKQEWVKNQSYNNGEPYQIDFDWEPSKDVYEILKMAGIKKSFTQSHLKDFVLYWKENGLALKSWNTKFVEFIRRKNLVENNHEEAKRSIESRQKENANKESKRNSWAENLDI